MENMENNFDVIIAGCGAAGLYGAINLPSDCRILLLCTQELTLCNSALAQGGIAGVYKSPEDSIELHEHDTSRSRSRTSIWNRTQRIWTV